MASPEAEMHGKLKALENVKRSIRLVRVSGREIGARHRLDERVESCKLSEEVRRGPP
jgi:hypothetical protein